MTEPTAITPEWIARAFAVPLWTLGIGDPPPPPTGWRRIRLWAANVVLRLAYRVETAAQRLSDWAADRIAPKPQDWRKPVLTDVVSRVDEHGEWTVTGRIADEDQP